MANPQSTRAEKPHYEPPPIDGDFYRIASVINDKERAVLRRVREFTEGVVAPVIEEYWGRDEFPFAIIPKMAAIGIGGVGYQGYGAAGGSWLLNGFVAMELARVDASVATFWGVHTGLSAGSIYLCGDEAQKQRWLPAMVRFEKIGSFGLTEPLVIQLISLPGSIPILPAMTDRNRCGGDPRASTPTLLPFRSRML